MKSRQRIILQEDSDNIEEVMSKHLVKEIEKVKKKINVMSSMVEDMVYLSTKSIIEKDPRNAEEIIKRDTEVDNLQLL